VRAVPRSPVLRIFLALGPPRAITVCVVLLLCAGWLGLAVGFGIVPVGPGLKDRLGGPAAGDFMFFYAAGVLTADGRAADAYDVHTLTSTARERVAVGVPELVWAYPPTMSLALAPLGRFQPMVALAVWVGLLTSSVIAISYLALGRWWLAPIGLLYPAAGLALFAGQFSPVLALLLAVFCARGWRSPVLGGAALGLFVWKPHFLAAPAIVALLDKRHRLLAASVTFGSAVVFASVAAFGIEAWIRFADAAIRHGREISAELPWARVVSVFGGAHTFGAGVLTGLVLQAVCALLALLAGLALWRRAAQASMRTFGLVAATLLVPPYALDYDLVFLLFPWLLMIRESLDDPQAASSHFWLWLGLTLLVPVSYLTSLYFGHPIAGALLLAMLGTTWWRLGRRVPPV
jgi:alpha-1,2-mannosyltransferase